MPANVYQLQKFGKKEKVSILKLVPENGCQLIHISLIDRLKTFFSERKMFTLENINLNIVLHIDGLPLFKSSPLNLWPILCKVKGIAAPIMPLSCFVGVGKPDFSELFSQMIMDN